MEELKVVDQPLVDYFGYTKEQLEEMSSKKLIEEFLKLQKQANTHLKAYADYDYFLFHLQLHMTEQACLLRSQYDSVNISRKKNLR